MTKKRSLVSLLLIVLLLVLAISFVTMAQSSLSFDLSWHVVGGGGGESSSANYYVSGTLGQPLVESSAAANSTVYSGYWVFDSNSRIYLPYVGKN